MNEMVNLVVELRGDRFGADALANAFEQIERAGLQVEPGNPGSDRFLAWIDQEFGGTWSSEAFAGKNIIAKRGEEPAGFATYDPRGLQFSWLRGLGAQPGTGIFGPFGVAPAQRGSPLGPALLIAALCELAHAGFIRALIPAVGSEKLIAYYQEHCGAAVAERFDFAQWRDRDRRAVVLASGNGTNFQSVVDGVASGDLPLQVAMLLSNKAHAYALRRARASGIQAVALPWDRKTQSRESYDADLLEVVRREQPELVLLLGWMHVLPTAFIDAFPHTINIHPAFLPLDQESDQVVFPDGATTPAFRGACAVDDALTFGSRWVGATAHRVTAKADTGPVLVRKPLAIAPGESVESIMQRLHPLEHKVLAGAIMRWVFEQ